MMAAVTVDEPAWTTLARETAEIAFARANAIGRRLTTAQRERIRKMSELAWRAFATGAPGCPHSIQHLHYAFAGCALECVAGVLPAESS